MEVLIKEIKNCRVCEKHLEWGINPIISASVESKIIIVGQAPGRLVHNTGIPWNDKSGRNLRSWLNISEEVCFLIYPMKKTLIVLLLVSGFAPLLFAQERLAAFEMNERLGRGINMGNAFEAPAETEWGNQWKPEYFEKMAEMGFQHVRVPIQWETSNRSLAQAPYTIEPAFLERIKEVVDHALANNLIIIINMHHHELLFQNPEAQKERFLNQWKQIAEFFKDYPEELIFEVLNEPHGNLTPELWNVFFADALATIRESNPERFVLMGTAEYGGLGGLSHLQLPDDENIMVTVHYYNPFQFTHQGAEWLDSDADGWLGTKWQDTEAERETVRSEFAPALAFSQDHNVPIHVGEFGAYSKADQESRVRWTTFLARWFEEQNLSWAYWEFSAGFGIYNPATNQVLQPLLDALLHNPMPDPVETEFITIYEGNFSNDTDGWILQVQSGLEASLDASAGSLKVSINNGGTEGWHVQLAKNDLTVQQGKMYRITVRASAESNRNATMYLGKASDPWNAYSGYISLSLGTQETVYSSTFVMNDPTDTKARLVFDLGNADVGVNILEVKLEEVIIGNTDDGDGDGIPTSVTVKEPAFKFYPNPVITHLILRNVDGLQSAFLFDLFGRMLEVFELDTTDTSINLEKHPPGRYFVMLQGNLNKRHVIQIVKK